MIAHVDMDAFYVSIEMLRHPELRGKPVVVAYDGPRGVVTTASYEARKYGVHSALPMVTARRRCPELTVLPVDMQLYQRGSVKVMETLREFSDEVEVVGLDEAYVDLSGSPVPQSRAQEIKRRIREATRLVCSIGLAPNKLMAKIASDLDKPDGFVRARPRQLARDGRREAGLAPAGRRPEARSSGCRRCGVETVGAAGRDRRARRSRGPSARSTAGACATGRTGSASTRLNEDRVRKSESRETTFPEDVTDRRVLHETVERLARSVCESLVAERAPRAHGDAEDPPAALQDLHALAHPPLPHLRPGVRSSATARELLDRFDPQRPGAAGGSRHGRAGGGRSASTTSPAS